MSTTTKAQHTPGPWQIIKARYSRQVRTMDGWLVSDVSTTCNDEGNREANARLIAACPDMLEALETAWCHHDLMSSGGWAKVHAAIRKAREG